MTKKLQNLQLVRIGLYLNHCSEDKGLIDFFKFFFKPVLLL